MSVSSEAVVDPVESQETLSRAMWTTGRLLSAALAFFFASFLFAFFYLRSVNSHGLWTTIHVRSPGPSTALGTVVAVATVASAALAYQGATTIRGTSALRSFVLPGGGALVLGLVAVIVQVIEFVGLPFGPTAGGYASVFIGWQGTFVVVSLLVLVWLEMLVAQALRSGGDAPSVAFCDSADAFRALWVFLAMVEVIAYVLLYYAK